MAQTMAGFSEALNLHMQEHASFMGKQFHIPIYIPTAEVRAWTEAIMWLEQRKAVDEEWAWPTWKDYRR